MTLTRYCLFLGILFPGLSICQTTGSSGTPSDSTVKMGIAAYIEGRYAEAIAALQPSSDSVAVAAYYLGSSYLAIGDVGTAALALKRAVALSPALLSYRVQYTKVLAQMGKDGDAINEYRQILSSDSTNAAALTGLGGILLERKSYEESALLLGRAVEQMPRNAQLFYQLGTALFRLSLFDSARTMLSTALTLNPAHLPTLTLLGSLYFGKQDYDQAFRVYAMAADRHPGNADLLYKAGLCLEKQSHYRYAKEFFLSAAAADSMHEYAFAHLGQACYQLGQYDSAISAYRTAAALDNDNPLYFVNMGIAWSRMDSTAQAAVNYRRAILLYHPESIGQMYERLGGLLFEKKRYREARDNYLKALQYAPASSSTQFNLALACDQLREYPSATIWYRKFLRGAKDDASMKKQLKEAKVRLKAIDGPAEARHKGQER